MNNEVWLKDNPLAGIGFEEFFTNPKLYLCGKPAEKLLEGRFFDSLKCHVRCGLCYGQAALAMFLLRDNPTARLVQGWANGTNDGTRHRHAWVECKHRGAWYVVDFAWLPWECIPVPRETYYNTKLTSAEPLWICRSWKFWHDSYNQLNYERCSRPETSWILPQLMVDYLPNPHKDKETAVGFYFPAKDGPLRNDRRYGKIMVPQVFRFTVDGGVISQHVIKELMKPGLHKVSPQTRWRADYQHQRFSKRIGIDVFYPV